MERKLRLVKAAPASSSEDAAYGDEADITPEELEAAALLREALERGEDPFADELRAAHAPGALADDDLDALVARALGEEDASTQAEREAAEDLRAELDGRAPVREAAIFTQLRVASSPPHLDPAKNDALIAAALSRAGRGRGVVRRLAPVTIAAVTGITALAAGLALFIGQPRVDPRSAAMIRARSTQELFDAGTPFPRSGEESARIDRIAAARAGDLRRNRFASWGVR